MGVTDEKFNKSLIEEMLKDMRNNSLGGALILYDDPVIVLSGVKICLSTIIHEINYLLSKEKLAEKRDDDGNLIDIERSYGIKEQAQYDFVYEVINELMTMDIFDIIKDQVVDNDILDLTYGSGYMDADLVLGYPTQKMYMLLKEEIKTSLIEGQGDKIRRIINGKNYAWLNVTLRNTYFQMINMIEEKGSIDYEDIPEIISRIPKDARDVLDNFQEKVEASYQEYLDYNDVMNEQLDIMEENGDIRRLK